jgi:hypothetical protein
MLRRAPKRTQETNLDSAAQGLVYLGLLILVIGVLGSIIKFILGLVVPMLIIGGVSAFIFFVVIPWLNHRYR